MLGFFKKNVWPETNNESIEILYDSLLKLNIPTRYVWAKQEKEKIR